MAQSAVIGALRVTLGLDSAEFEKGLKKTQETVAGLNLGKGLLANLKSIEAGFHDTAGAAGVFGGALARFGGVGLAAAASLGVFVEVMKRTREAINDAAEFGKLAKTVGVSTDFIQQFNFAARQSDVDVGAADEALKGLNVSMGLVEKGLARAQTTRAFAALGFTPEQLRGFKDAGEFLPVLAEAISHAGNAAEQAAIAQRLKIGELLPLLKDGAAGFNKLAQEARDLGIVMDSDLVRKSEEAKKKLLELDDVMKAKANKSFAEFADTLIDIKQRFADAEVAGLKFLAALTGTQTVDQKIADTQQALTFRALQGVQKGEKGSFIESQTHELARTLAGLQIQRAADRADQKPEDSNNPPATGALGSGKKTPSNVTASDEAIARARKAELDAEIALTADIARLAVLRQRQVDEETADANRKLQDEAHEKKISQAAADTAVLANNRAAGERKAKIVQDAVFAAQNQELAHRQAVEQFTQQAATVEAGLAKTAAARADIEAKALVERQATERARLKASLDQQVTQGLITDADEKEELAAQALAQAAETKRQAVDAGAAIQAETNAQAEAALSLQIDLLSAQADAADTDGQRLQIRLHILDLEQQLEKLKLQEVLSSVTATDAEKKIAQARLDILGQLNSAQTKALVGGLFDSFRSAESAVGGLANAFQSHNWGQVAQSLVSTVQSLQVAFGPNGTIGGKIGAVAGIGSAVGSAVGGTAGSAISGAAGGATLGFTVGGPVGAAVGAVLGGIFGLFSGSSAKKAQQASDAKAAADAAAAHAASVSAEAIQLQIQVLNAEGKAEEALALQRQAALSAVNAENRDLESQLLDLQDAAEKAAKAQAIANEGHGLQIQLLELTGDATGALIAKRADELAALDAANRGLQQEIFNLQDLAVARAAAAQAVDTDKANLAAARDAEAQALTDTINKFQAYADSLTAYARSLDPVAASPVTANLSTLAAQFASTAARAQLGDPAALGDLQGIAEQYRASGLAQAHTAQEAKAVEDKIRAGVTAAADTAGRQVSIAQQSLNSLKSLVDAELGTTAAVQSVDAAIQALHADLAGLAALGPAVNTIANLALAEGSNIVPLAPIPAAPSAPSALTTPTTGVDAATIAPGVSSGDFAGALAFQSRALAQIAKNTGSQADDIEQFAAIGIGTYAAA